MRRHNLPADGVWSFLVARAAAASRGVDQYAGEGEWCPEVQQLSLVYRGAAHSPTSKCCIALSQRVVRETRDEAVDTRRDVTPVFVANIVGDTTILSVTRQ